MEQHDHKVGSHDKKPSYILRITMPSAKTFQTWLYNWDLVAKKWNWILK
jgi:hypothetical protein